MAIRGTGAARGVACVFLLLCGAVTALAQGTRVAQDDPDWIEVSVVPPASFRREGLVPIEMSAFVGLRYGIDPASVSVAADSIVRYVVVATSASGAVNVMYEGLNCHKAEFKTYARWGSSNQWNLATRPEWRPLNENNVSRHALALARQGACEGRTVPNSAQDVISRLKNPLRSP